MDMLQKLAMVYDKLQKLQIPPTKSNMETLLSALAIIQQAATYIEKVETEKKDGNDSNE